MESAQDTQTPVAPIEPTPTVVTPLPGFETPPSQAVDKQILDIPQQTPAPIVKKISLWQRLGFAHWFILFLLCLVLAIGIYKGYQVYQQGMEKTQVLTPIVAPCTTATPAATLTPILPTKVATPTVTPIYIRVTATPTLPQHVATVSAK